MTTLKAVLAVAAKDFRIARSYRLGFALTIFGFFWSLVSFRFLSKLVNVGQFAGDPTSYFRFVVVGVVLTSVLHAAASSAANAARSDQVQGTLEYLATQPVSRLALGLGWAAYSVLESLIAAVVILLASFPLGFRVVDPNIPVAIATLALSAMVFCAIGIIGASVVVAFQQGQSLAGTAASLAGLISGTMFPVTVLPAWVRPFSDASPLTHALAALRSSILPNQPHTSLVGDLSYLAVSSVVLLVLSGLGLELAFRHAQRRGALSTF